VKPKKLMSLAAFELGPSGNNPHLHALIGGLPRNLGTKDLDRILGEMAKSLSITNVQVARYDDRLGAVPYLFKEVNYSMRVRHDDGRWPMVSENVYQALRRNPNGRHGAFSRGAPMRNT